MACASNIIAAMSTRLAIRLPHGWRLRPMPRSTLPLVIQITECVESAQEPVVVEVPVYVPEEVPVYVPLDPAYAAVLVLVILDWSKVMRAPHDQREIIEVADGGQCELANLLMPRLAPALACNTTQLADRGKAKVMRLICSMSFSDPTVKK